MKDLADRVEQENASPLVIVSNHDSCANVFAKFCVTTDHRFRAAKFCGPFLFKIFIFRGN